MGIETIDHSTSRIIREGDPDYDERRATFNAMIDRRPARIVSCSTVGDVVAAVRGARADGLPISIRGGGHSVAGHCIGDGAVVVDLRGMRRVDVDPDRRRAIAGGGTTWEEYDTATQRYGLASTGGTFTDTGIAGLTLGGGIGHLQGRLGLAVDCLSGAWLVTADGEVVHTSEDEHPDLFWAIRGGGGNFGVVTDFEFRLHPVTELYGGMIAYPASAATEVLALARDLALRAPDELVLTTVIGTNRASGKDAAVVSACYQGGKAEGERAVASLRQSSLPVMVDALRPLTYAEMQATFPLLPFGFRHYWKGHFLTGLSDELIGELEQSFWRRPRPGFAAVLVEFISGAPTRVGSEEMAFNQRDARINASALGVWQDPAQDDAHMAWARESAAKLEPSATGASYVNYMADDEPAARVRAAYGDAKFARLRQIKRRYDPDNVFRFNQNIPPAD
ncbi:MAG: FAD-binding oxidoreductase [Candidatus Dormibacteraceae bacterium]